MQAEELLQQLLAAKEKYGHLDVPVSVFILSKGERTSVGDIDVFEDSIDGKSKEQTIHSIDINTL